METGFDEIFTSALVLISCSPLKEVRGLEWLFHLLEMTNSSTFKTNRNLC